MSPQIYITGNRSFGMRGASIELLPVFCLQHGGHKAVDNITIAYLTLRARYFDEYLLF